MERQERCKKIVTAINQLGQTQIDELFKLLHTNKCKYTQNTNGVFVNLSWISDDLLTMIEQYVAFCNQSRTEVCKYESLCEVLNRNLVDGPHESDPPASSSTVSLSHTVVPDSSAASASSAANVTRVSSSMKFYLLKKKFAKQSNVSGSGNIKNDLRPEAYIIARSL